MVDLEALHFEIEELLERYAGAIGDCELGGVEDWVLVAAVDDVGSGTGGGHVVMSREGSHHYRAIGLLYYGVSSLEDDYKRRAGDD